jgi:Sporulation and spore germination
MRFMRRRALHVVAVIALAMVGAVACGVPADDDASKLPNRDVPFGLLDQEAGSNPADAGQAGAFVYFAKNGQLVASSRNLAPPITARSLVNSLSRGPNRVEIAAGLRSALPDGAIGRVSLASGTARVDLERPFTELSSSDQITALGQLVYTLTGQPGVGLVRFTLMGASTEVPRADGSLTPARVSRDDYAAIAPA